MEAGERRRRMKALRTTVFDRDVNWWTREFLTAMAGDDRK
jgi:trehalose-6-phosphate synthase